MRIQHNILALNAYRNYQNNTNALGKNLEKLSSGYRINRAGDDAAGLAISEKMRAQITGLDAAQKNVKDGISLVKTAEGAMQEIHDMLNRMDYLATQSANGTYQDEVDRDNLQKEVESLRNEINRIADSSNFNGINLLDGKLGLNTKAFTIDSAAAVDASDGAIDISNLVSADPATSTSSPTHLEVAGNATQTDPAFTIDLGNLELNATAAGTAKIDVLGQEIQLALTAGGGSGANGEYTASDLATALETALKDPTKNTYAVKAADGTVGTAAQNGAVKIGDIVLSFAANGSKIDFTYAGLQTGTTAATWKGTGDFTEAQATAINNAIGQGVTLTDAGGAAQKGDVIHDTTNVTYAVAKSPSSMAGIDIKLTADYIKDGGTLKIDGKTFTFKTDPNSTVVTGAAAAGGNGGVIDVSTAKTDAERVHMAVDALSKQTVTGDESRTWTISSKDNEWIHIDQTASSATNKTLDTYDKLVSKIEIKGPATEAKNAGTSVKINQSEIKEGDTLNIDGKKFIFSDKNTGSNYVAIKGDAAANLKNALTTAGLTAEIDSTDTTKVIVRAATAEEMAPSILGKGMTLQIGDTADDFNQLTFAIGDMHDKGMGIQNIRIDNQPDAQSAIQTIKDAINYVSSVRGDLGAIQNRLEHTSNNLSVMAENIQDAESTIRDTDVAAEMMAYTKNNILVQSAQAMLAQANAVPQGVLQLLQ